MNFLCKMNKIRREIYQDDNESEEEIEENNDFESDDVNELSILEKEENLKPILLDKLKKVLKKI